VQAKFISVLVEDQEKALKFYTEKLGFAKMADISMGDYRWLTVTPPDGPEGVEVVLEPAAFPPAKVYQRALFDAGIPITALTTGDVRADFERLKTRGVVFRGEPVDSGPVVLAVFEDTCGNLIHLAQPKT
jgi:catechol 2,3-dioxygenase-like lactoylglutathione lyase family enzyme